MSNDEQTNPLFGEQAKPIMHPSSPRMSKIDATVVGGSMVVGTMPQDGEEQIKGPVAGSKEMNRWWLGVLIAIALVISGGVLHGQWSNRWGVKQDIVALGNKLRTIPMEIGDWSCQEEGQLDEDAEALLEVKETKGYISRTYSHRSTGESVNVFVIFGPKGPVAVHTPEVCYSARAVHQTSAREAVGIDLDGASGELWKLAFETNTFDKRRMSVYYGWSDGGAWTAAKSPRFWRTDYLYKIQTACQASGNKEDSTDEFFKVFLPEVRKQMREKS